MADLHIATVTNYYTKLYVLTWEEFDVAASNWGWEHFYQHVEWPSYCVLGVTAICVLFTRDQ